MTDNALVVYDGPKQVNTDLEQLRVRVEEVLPARVDPDRFLRVAAQAITTNPKLMECSRVSLLSAITTAAQLGLEPSGLLGSAYLVPYRRSVVTEDDKGRSVKRKVMVAQLIPGYRGLIDLARRSGEIDAIFANVVNMRDSFDYEPSRQPDPVRHRPFIPNPSDSIEDRDPGPFVGAYMLATLRGGYVQPEFMTYDQVESVRKSSKAADDGPWVAHWSEMSRKTVVRRGSKYLPLTTDFRTALELDEIAERGAEAPPAPRPMNKAAAMLVERAQRTQANGDGKAANDPGADDPGPQEPPTAPTGDATPCGAVHPQDTKVSCVRQAGHDGGHADEQQADTAEYVWPQEGA